MKDVKIQLHKSLCHHINTINNITYKRLELGFFWRVFFLEAQVKNENKSRVKNETPKHETKNEVPNKEYEAQNKERSNKDQKT